MGSLNNALIYLGGPIDNATDDGVGWRQEIRAKTQYMNIKWLDPTDKPIKLKVEIGDEKTRLIKLKDAARFDELSAYVKSFRREDLRFVDISDAIVAYIDPDIHSVGTYDEIFTVLMERQCKPRMLIIKGGIKRCPNWLFAVFKVSDMFETVDECVQRLVDINFGNYAMSREWVLIRDCI